MTARYRRARVLLPDDLGPPVATVTASTSRGSSHTDHLRRSTVTVPTTIDAAAWLSKHLEGDIGARTGRTAQQPCPGSASFRSLSTASPTHSRGRVRTSVRMSSCVGPTLMPRPRWGQIRVSFPQLARTDAWRHHHQAREIRRSTMPTPIWIPSITGSFERLSLFAGCTPRQLQRVGTLSTQVEVGAGRVLLREGAHVRQPNAYSLAARSSPSAIDRWNTSRHRPRDHAGVVAFARTNALGLTGAPSATRNGRLR